MKKIGVCILAGIVSGIVLFLSGCAGAPSNLPPISDQAVVTITREYQYANTPTPIYIFIDNKKAGTVKNVKNSRLQIPVKNGTHTIRAKGTGLLVLSETLTFTADSNELVFKTYYTKGILKDTLYLVPVDEKVAAE